MIILDETQAECFVFTEKEGLLSPVAHDLRIRVGSFRVELDPASGAVRGRFDAGSLRVVHAMKGGVDAPTALSAKDKAEIEGNIRKDVLHADRFRDITFAAELGAGAAAGTERTVSGKLTLHGTTRDVSVRVSRAGAQLQAEARLHQPDFGIKPYTAMFGALKVKADLRVVLSVAAEKLGG